MVEMSSVEQVGELVRLQAEMIELLKKKVTLLDEIKTIQDKQIKNMEARLSMYGDR